MVLTKINGDLFRQDSKYALAHCIASDAKMGAGIATQFVARYPQMRTAISTDRPSVGGIFCYTEIGKPDVLNLITKQKSSGKPTRSDFNRTIENLKEFAITRGITHIAIPLLGADLDKLDWAESEEHIRSVFEDTGIEILLCLNERSRGIHDASWDKYHRVRSV